MFEAVSNNSGAKDFFPKMEEEVLKFWEEDSTFEKSLAKRRDAQPFVFYDGPPFATGLPHYGHLLAGTIKDVIPRYQTMRGRYVERVFGWDCHGLPIEALAQKALGLAGTPSILEKGVDVFNEQCRSMVQTYVSEWKQIVTRMGRWVDFDHGYKTMDKTFMETIWWVFKQLWDQGRIYRAHRIVPYSWALCTPLSNNEASANYKDVQDPTVTIRMKVTNRTFPGAENLNTYIIIWTTTPWTLPANLAACVGPDIDYCVVKDGDTNDAYIMAKARIPAYYRKESEYTIVYECKGSELVGTQYEPIFPYYKDNPNSFRVLSDGYVTTTDGTGIVHIAPAYGEDDYRVCRTAGIPLVDPLDESAKFTSIVPEFAGVNCKEADKAIIKYLKQIGKLVAQSTIVHSYPYCERSDTPLIYRAIEAWYVKVEDIQDRMVHNNESVKWMPDFVGEKRFANWLKDARDWNISRNRFWGSCIPIWINVEDKEDMICVGSIAELEKLSGQKVEDLHKHYVDKIEIVRDGKRYRRTPEVLDCWFESGSMPYAQHHYPFENQDKVDKNFPADFIAEGLDQTRGWFYSLMQLSTMLFDKPPYKNVVVNGLVLAADGKKMSKHLHNYPDPMDVVNVDGADAIRLCMLSSPVVRAEDLRFSEEAVREVLRTVIIPLWNVNYFLVTYARVDGWKPKNAEPPRNPANLLDRWVVSRTMAIVADLREAMDNYDLQRAAVRFTSFLDELTNWYIRRSRRRFWKSDNDGDKNEAYQTLYFVLLTFCKMAAPFIPFITEKIYRNLRTDEMPESVHLCDYPEVDESFLDMALNKRMERTMSAVSLGHSLRTQSNLKVRQPLQSTVLVSADAGVRADLESMADVIAEELNVKECKVIADEESLVSLSAKPNMKKLGPKLGAKMKLVLPLIGALDSAAIGKLRKGETLSLTASDGSVFDITEEDVMIKRTEKEGLTVANEGDITVGLDTRLSKELIQEGWAREVVSKLQNLRKELNFQVTDRINVIYDGTAEMCEAIEAFKSYISNETLALSLEKGAADDMHEVEMNGVKAQFSVRKAH